MRSRVLVLLAGVALAAVPATAEQSPDRADQPSAPRAGQTAPALNADNLPVSLSRLHKQLDQLPPSTNATPLRLEYYIEVYGKAPRLDFLNGVDLAHGPVPYGAPTHQDFLNFWTPQEFRTPPADLSAVFKWITQQLAKKKTG